MQTSRHLKKNHKKSTKAHKRTRKIKVSIKKKTKNQIDRRNIIVKKKEEEKKKYVSWYIKFLNSCFFYGFNFFYLHFDFEYHILKYKTPATVKQGTNMNDTVRTPLSSITFCDKLNCVGR